MPFIEQNKLASLYKEIEEERNSSNYFQKLHEENKKKLLASKSYQIAFYVLLFLIVSVGSVLYLNKPNAKGFESETDQITLDSIDAKKVFLKPIKFIEQFDGSRVYSVQITATSDQSYILFSENFVNFKAHSLGDLIAYSIGVFSTEEEAITFQKKLIEMGIKDAWVVAYENGERIILNN